MINRFITHEWQWYRRPIPLEGYFTCLRGLGSAQNPRTTCTLVFARCRVAAPARWDRLLSNTLPATRTPRICFYGSYEQSHHLMTTNLWVNGSASRPNGTFAIVLQGDERKRSASIRVAHGVVRGGGDNLATGISSRLSPR
ncbi:hypothetical protein KCP73_06395 [Salmonella enterica subsp. enterica]|nr:hypothetical protein KCP73_06395 [Salmonella enterica subsp. enterica]